MLHSLHSLSVKATSNNAEFINSFVEATTSSTTEIVDSWTTPNTTELINFGEDKIKTSTPNSERRPLLDHDSPWSFSPSSLDPMLIEITSRKRNKDTRKLLLDGTFHHDIKSESEDDDVVVKKGRTQS